MTRVVATVSQCAYRLDHRVVYGLHVKAAIDVHNPVVRDERLDAPVGFRKGLLERVLLVRVGGTRTLIASSRSGFRGNVQDDREVWPTRFVVDRARSLHRRWVRGTVGATGALVGDVGQVVAVTDDGDAVE